MAEQPQPNKTEARAGVTLGAMRWVLLISVVLAVIGMIIAFAGSPAERVTEPTDAAGATTDTAGTTAR